MTWMQRSGAWCSQFGPFVSEPDVQLGRTLELGEFRKDELNGCCTRLSGVCQSRPLRARRGASIASTAPTRPSQVEGQQSLEAWTTDADARLSEIVIHDLDNRPAKLLGAIGEPILSLLALKIVHGLIRVD